MNTFIFAAINFLRNLLYHEPRIVHRNRTAGFESETYIFELLTLYFHKPKFDDHFKRRPVSCDG